MTDSAPIQDHYPQDVAHCYGCGRLNDAGHQIKTRAVGDTTVTEFTPELYHTAMPGYAYGGLVASIIDCHSTGSAAIFAMRERGIPIEAGEALRFVTAHLEVDYLLPTPLEAFHLVGRVKEIRGRKVVVETDLSVEGEVTAKGSAVLIEIPESFVPPGS
ncbi:MAG: PaaI family thioesterase [Actinomycetota bacterium]